jgi:lipopolysaccharide export system protein LptC
MYKKTIANYASILLAVVISVTLFEQLFFKDNEPDPKTGSNNAQPQWYIKTAHIRTFNETGKLTQNAEAKRVRYFRKQDIAYLDAPRLTSYPDDSEGSEGSEGSAKAWQTSADFGQFREDFDVVDLRENVRIAQDHGGITMTTQQLILTNSTNTAETDKPLLITNGSSRTNAVGMHAWLDQEKIELLAKVRTIHEPQ